MILATFIAEVKERLAKTQAGPFFVQRYDNEGGYISYQVETERNDNNPVFAWCSELTNFRFAKANAELIAHAPTDLAKLLAVVEVYEEALKEASDKAKSKAEFTRAAFGAIADEALARADQIVKGENHE